MLSTTPISVELELTSCARFKTFGYITCSQALTFVSDLKFGHYMKIPPRTMFMAQVVATTFSCFIQIITLNYALNAIPGVCTPDQPEHFTCPGGRVFFSGMFVSLPMHCTSPFVSFAGNGVASIPNCDF